jgi:hypothetical protein
VYPRASCVQAAPSTLTLGIGPSSTPLGQPDQHADGRVSNCCEVTARRLAIEIFKRVGQRACMITHAPRSGCSEPDTVLIYDPAGARCILIFLKPCLSKIHPDPGDPKPCWRTTHKPATARYKQPCLGEALTRKGPRQAVTYATCILVNASSSDCMNAGLPLALSICCPSHEQERPVHRFHSMYRAWDSTSYA